MGLCTKHVWGLSMVNSTCAHIDMSSNVNTLESCAPVVYLCMIGIASELLTWAVNSDDEEERSSLCWTNDDSYQGMREMMNNTCLKP